MRSSVLEHRLRGVGGWNTLSPLARGPGTVRITGRAALRQRSEQHGIALRGRLELQPERLDGQVARLGEVQLFGGSRGVPHLRRAT